MIRPPRRPPLFPTPPLSRSSSCGGCGRRSTAVPHGTPSSRHATASATASSQLRRSERGHRASPTLLVNEVHGLVLAVRPGEDRKSTRLNSSHDQISYAVFCL